MPLGLINQSGDLRLSIGFFWTPKVGEFLLLIYFDNKVLFIF